MLTVLILGTPSRAIVSRSAPHTRASLPGCTVNPSPSESETPRSRTAAVIRRRRPGSSAGVVGRDIAALVAGFSGHAVA